MFLSVMTGKEIERDIGGTFNGSYLYEYVDPGYCVQKRRYTHDDVSPFSVGPEATSCCNPDDDEVVPWSRPSR